MRLDYFGGSVAQAVAKREVAKPDVTIVASPLDQRMLGDRDLKPGKTESAVLRLLTATLMTPRTDTDSCSGPRWVLFRSRRGLKLSND